MKSSATGMLLAGGLLFCTAGNSQQEPENGGRPITPAGELVMDAGSHLPAVGALPVAFVRSPDTFGHDAQGRYLLVINSGFGIQFSEDTNHAQQSIAVVDLNASPNPAVIQNVYFPSPQSVNVGAIFSSKPRGDGSFELYVSGGFENKIWIFNFNPTAAPPIRPGSPGPSSKVDAPSILISNPGETSPKDYNDGKAALYPTGVAITSDGETLLAANNLGDSLTIVSNLHGEQSLERVDLHHPGKLKQNIYPYDVVIAGTGKGDRAYVSCWNDSSVAVISLSGKAAVQEFIAVDRHPTAMLLNKKQTRLFVVNSNADNISVIDTATNREIERIDVRLWDKAPAGSSPEGIALNNIEDTLYVANAHSNAVAVVALSGRSRGNELTKSKMPDTNSRVLGFIPTGQYPSAVAVADGRIFIGNGKGTGFEPSSMRVNNSGRTPNPPNAAFPPNPEKNNQGGQYILSLVSGNISMLAVPSGPELARYTRQTMQNDVLFPRRRTFLPEKIKHVIYIIKENRTYDQVFGDVRVSGDGTKADGQPDLAIFGNGAAAARPSGATQVVTPNHHALAQRFGLFDRFFVNSEASPDGHNWSTAAFSTDYTDKGMRWEYSGRGRTYDWEGFNRLPEYEPPGELDTGQFQGDILAALIDLLEKHIPYRQGFTDLAEPKTLYLWDAAARAGLTYRNYGEFVTVISANDVVAATQKRSKGYPDISPARRSIASKQALENHHSESFRSFDITNPDSFTVDCYNMALDLSKETDPAVTRENTNEKCRGNSRLGEWLREFNGFVSRRDSGGGDAMPALSVMRFPNDHTTGMKPGFPTPQFLVADNDYAVGRLVEAVSSSSYWKDTAIFVVEDDAQAGPDHVDAHRSVALAISAYNRPGALIHKFHSTVSMIRTMEMLLGMAPMNQLDVLAVPMDIFREAADLTPYKAILPTIAADNRMTAPAKDRASAYWIRKTLRQDFSHADVADPAVLNAAIWFACKGENAVPASGQLPAFAAMRLGIADFKKKKKSLIEKDDDD